MIFLLRCIITCFDEKEASRQLRMLSMAKGCGRSFNWINSEQNQIYMYTKYIFIYIYLHNLQVEFLCLNIASWHKLWTEGFHIPTPPQECFSVSVLVVVLQFTTAILWVLYRLMSLFLSQNWQNKLCLTLSRKPHSWFAFNHYINILNVYVV